MTAAARCAFGDRPVGAEESVAQIEQTTGRQGFIGSFGLGSEFGEQEHGLGGGRSPRRHRVVHGVRGPDIEDLIAEGVTDLEDIVLLADEEVEHPHTQPRQSRHRGDRRRGGRTRQLTDRDPGGDELRPVGQPTSARTGDTVGEAAAQVGEPARRIEPGVHRRPEAQGGLPPFLGVAGALGACGVRVLRARGAGLDGPLVQGRLGEGGDGQGIPLGDDLLIAGWLRTSGADRRQRLPLGPSRVDVPGRGVLGVEGHVFHAEPVDDAHGRDHLAG